MNESHVTFDIPDYVEGRLNDSHRNRVREHLAGCPECRHDLKETEAALGMLSRARMDAPENMYWSSLLPRVRTGIEHRPAIQMPRGLSAIALPAAFAVLVILFLLRLPSGKEASEELSGLMDGLPSEEVSALVDEEIVSSILAGGITSTDSPAGQDDRAIIATLIGNAIPDLTPDATGETSLLDGFSADDLENLAQLLEREYPDL